MNLEIFVLRVRARLLDQARAERSDLQILLTRYEHEFQRSRLSCLSIFTLQFSGATRFLRAQAIEPRMQPLKQVGTDGKRFQD